MWLINRIRVERPQEGPGRRPARWSDLGWILLPLYPWIALAVLSYLVVRWLW